MKIIKDDKGCYQSASLGMYRVEVTLKPGSKVKQEFCVYRKGFLFGMSIFSEKQLNVNLHNYLFKYYAKKFCNFDLEE